MDVKELRESLGIDDYLELVKEDKNCNGAYISFGQYMYLLENETQELKKQLDYLRSGEYLNQLRFERDMLQHVVDNSEVPKVDKEFIDMTHRNTELLAQQKEFIEWLENKIKYWEEQEQQWLNLGFMKFGGEANNKIIFKKILSKYKEIIGVRNE